MMRRVILVLLAGGLLTACEEVPTIGNPAQSPTANVSGQGTGNQKSDAGTGSGSKGSDSKSGSGTVKTDGTVTIQLPTDDVIF